MIFCFNVLICAVILWCHQSNVPISMIDRSLLCIVLFKFLRLIYTGINDFEVFLVYFLSGHCKWERVYSFYTWWKWIVSILSMLFSRSDSVYSMSSVAMLLIYTYKKYMPLSVTITYTVDDNGIGQQQIHIPEYQ